MLLMFVSPLIGIKLSLPDSSQDLENVPFAMFCLGRGSIHEALT